tara:strand:+ start:111 stop:1337 length:1227 start_codon:yes stop_codon:yes gene_type:complete
MNDKNFTTIKQVNMFLEGTKEIHFERKDAKESYQWTQKILIKFQYHRLNKIERGAIRNYIKKVTGYSRSQVTRLIQKYSSKGTIRKATYKRSKFLKKYSSQDIRLLANTDRLHRLSGPAIKKILEYEVTYGNHEYNTIANISISHLYNLRKTRTYQLKHTHYSRTKSVTRNIAERRKPTPKGMPGYIRIDTVHQGDLNGEKGVYHINAVDEVTQWEIVISVEKISNAYLIPALKEILDQFPFWIQSFHSDNGSEYINKVVARLLNNLLIRFTKSRARHSNDNALAESKNASVIRKHLGHAHIPQKYAKHLNAFHRKYLNVYLNFHRPCFFPEITINKKGKIKKSYPYNSMMTPFQKLCSIYQFEGYLKQKINVNDLYAIANKYSPNQFMKIMLDIQGKLWNTIFEQAA